MILIGLATLAPFANIQLSRVESFIPVSDVIISLSGIITSVLLFGQFLTIRSRALLFLANGYLFMAMIAVSHALTFPGAFSPTGLLGAGPQSAGWIFVFWHFGFPLAIIGYVLAKKPGKSVHYPAFPRIFPAAMVVAGLVCFLTWIATAKEQSLPVLLTDGTTFASPAPYAAGVDLILSALALVLLLKRGWSILDTWLAVATCAFVAKLVITTALVSGRFTLGWYSGRAFAILVSWCFIVNAPISWQMSKPLWHRLPTK
jgi:hypothetical protein